MDKQITSRYDDAIERAQVEAGSNRKLELRQCLRNWASKEKDRNRLFGNLLSAEKSTSPIVILEIGNSGFPRYDYILVEGSTIKSSFKAQTSRDLVDDVHAIISGISAHDMARYRGSAHSSIDDGDCYFLTVRKDGAIKQVAVYGELGSTSSGLLTKDLISAVTGNE
ncbi:MAG TPA: hypothetical protein VFG91_11480 [Woeseiaceae bacterium]|nr:hypothetical protein [Woeseiaceae bacterium]